MAADCSCETCCSFPNGRMAVISMLMAILSYGLALSAVYGCHYIELGGEIGVGLWTVETLIDDDYECREWTNFAEDNLDATWRAARAMGSLATASGLVVMVAGICLACLSFSKVCLQAFGLLAAFGGLVMSLTFIVFSADYCDRGLECEFGANAGVAIGAVLCYWITGCLFFKIPEAPERQPPVMTPAGQAATLPPPGTTTVTTTELPDGTKKTTTTTVNADGSQTVQETIEPASAVVGEATVMDSKVY